MQRCPLWSQLVRRLLHDVFNVWRDNTDEWRFPPAHGGRLGGRPRFKARLKGKLEARGFVSRPPADVLDRTAEQWDRLMQRREEFELVWGLLADDYSRRLLIDLLAWRLLGPRHVKLAQNNPEHWRLRASVPAHRRGADPLWSGRWRLERYAVPGTEGLIELYAEPLTVLQWLLEQYAYRRNGVTISARPGDVVVDCGAWIGDVSLYFADRVGPAGRVMALEFEPSNLDLLRTNLALNRHLSDRVAVIERALWDRSGLELSFRADGPSSALESGADVSASTPTTTTVTLDDLVESEKLDRVDFIKMDVEGAELAALRGAEATLRRWRPALAISAYHRPDDLVEIPRYLVDLQLGYAFYLDHFTIHGEETVLFGHPPARAASRS
jgi:FkbM family methyltransferase